MTMAKGNCKDCLIQLMMGVFTLCLCVIGYSCTNKPTCPLNSKGQLFSFCAVRMSITNRLFIEPIHTSDASSSSPCVCALNFSRSLDNSWSVVPWWCLIPNQLMPVSHYYRSHKANSMFTWRELIGIKEDLIRYTIGALLVSDASSRLLHKLSHAPTSCDLCMYI